MKTKTKRRVIWVYMRRSGDKQHESLGRQEDEITADDVVAKADEIVRPFFIDDAVSGTLSLERRKGGAKLLGAVKDFHPHADVEQIIVIDDVSRLSREKNPYAVASFLAPCFDKGIRVYFRRDRLWSSDPMFEVMFSLHRRRAADFSADLSGKVFEGQLRLCQTKHAHVGGKADYGFDRIVCDVDGTPLRRYVVTNDLYLHCYNAEGTEEIQDALPPRVKKTGGPLGPAGIGKSLGQYIVLAKTVLKDRAEAIEFCFQSILDGVVPNTIARDLIKRGVASPGGKRWRGDTVVRLVKNSIYYGQDYYNKRSRSAFSGVKRGDDGLIHRVAADDPTRMATKNGRSVSQDHWVVMKLDPSLAYVTKDVWDRANAIIISRRPFNRGGRYSDRVRTSPHLLGGLVRCAHCERNMQIARRAGNKPILFACQTNKHEPDRCEWKSIQAPLLDGYVVDVVESLILREPIENLRVEIESLLAEREDAPAEDPVPGIRSAIGALDAKLKTLWQRFESPKTRRELLDDIQEQIIGAKGEKAALETKLSEVESAKPNPKAIERSADSYLEKIQELRESLESGDPSLRRTAIRSVVGQVRLLFEKNKARKIQSDPAYILKKGSLVFAGGALGIGSLASA